MTLTYSAPTVTGARAERLPRVAALVSAGCLLTHVVLLGLTGESLLVLTVPMLLLSGMCAACAASAWRRRCTDLELAVMLVLGLAMVAVHLLLAPMHEGHEHVEVSTTTDLLMHGGLSLALTAEVVAGVALVRRLIRSR
ncbi:hypothetical protein JCM18899A_42330 [Nocardioides sp. AN3]